jgi:hypothetical protein
MDDSYIKNIFGGLLSLSKVIGLITFKINLCSKESKIQIKYKRKKWFKFPKNGKINLFFPILSLNVNKL